MSAVFLALLALVSEAIKDTPAIITEIEALIANAKKSAAGGDPSSAPIEPGIAADTAALAAKLAGK